MNQIETLAAIHRMVNKLNPPVKDFEQEIRRSPFRILISVLLSSRTKDSVTLKASESLFNIADTPNKMRDLPVKEIARLIYPVGFYQQKAKHINRIAHILSDNPEKGVPKTFEALVSLPGVGRKTANLVLALAFNIPAIAVDTHVFRIAQRLGWARGDKPEEVEEQLKNLFPENFWNKINQTLVGFGQTICKPQAPLCDHCKVTSQCPFYRNGESQ